MVKAVLSKEQVIAQHEKNIQDFQYQTVQSLENLKRQFGDIQKAVSDMQVRQVSTQNDIKFASDLNSNKIDEHFRATAQMVGDLKSELLFHKEQFLKQLDDVKLLYICKSDYDPVIDELTADVNGFYESQTKLFHGFESSLKAALANFESKIESFKKHILEAPIPELSQIPALEQKIAEAQIDKQSVLQELRALTRQVFVQSKYIEQLQTDIKKCRN